MLAEADESARAVASSLFETVEGVRPIDRTDAAFVTLDPASSTDLDQAFTLDMSGDDVLLRYAIADVGRFVRPGGAVDAEAWRRGLTLYLPDERAGLHPPRLAEDAASLLPDVPRPAVIFVVRVAEDGAAILDGVERAVIRSRVKLAYETVTLAHLPASFPEFARRIEAAEIARGADRVEAPEQEVLTTASGYELRFRPRSAIEVQSAGLSLATNLAVADVMARARTGLFRVMAGVDDTGAQRLRHTAQAFGLSWPSSVPLAEFVRSLPPDDRRTGPFLLAVRRAGGGASYRPYDETVRPWHAAVAATYCHATAPLRRLADRYVIEASLALAAGRSPAAWVDEAFDRLPSAMQRAESASNRVERAVLDVAEAVVLAGRAGEVFDAVVTDVDDRGARIQIADPAIVTRVDARRVVPGDAIRVRLVDADPVARTVEFERVS